MNYQDRYKLAIKAFENLKDDITTTEEESEVLDYFIQYCYDNIEYHENITKAIQWLRKK